MAQCVEYQDQGKVALITLDDGNVNAVSPSLLEQLNSALDTAESTQQVVVITGREKRFSGGFDLSVMNQGGQAMIALVTGGARLALRLATFKTPVVIACTGHSIAMGALLLLSADYRVAVDVDAKIGLNEVVIGLPLAYFGVELARARISAKYLSRAVNNGEIFSPQGALAAGYVDEVVPPEQLLETSLQRAQQLSHLNMAAHYETKLRLRADLIKGMQWGIDNEFKNFPA